MATFDTFLADINQQLFAQHQEAVKNTEQWLIIHCFGYGMTVQETVSNLLHDRD